MGRNLGPLNIKDSYEGLVQISGSQLTDGSGSLISDLNITASDATTATTASYVETAQTASYVAGANVDGTVALATSASHAVQADNATSADTATSASFATTASYAENVEPFDSGSLLITASAVDATTTYTKGDGSTFTTTINNVTSSISSSYVAGANVDGAVATATSASHAVNADTAISSSYATTASFAENVTTPTLQQVTTEGATTDQAIEIDGSATSQLTIKKNGLNNVRFITNDSQNSIVINTSGSQAAKIDFNDGAGEIEASGDLTLDTTGNTVQVLDSMNVQTALTASGLNYPTADGTVDQVLKTDGAGNLAFTTIDTDPFPYTGSAIISGSLEVTGSVKSIGGIAMGIETFPTSLTTNGNVVIGGSGNGNSNNGPRITAGTAGVVLGGYNTTISSTGLWNSILGGSGNQITGGGANTVVGGYYNTLSGNGEWRSIFGAKNSSITATGANPRVIVGGDGGSITAGADSAIIGGDSNTVSHDRSVVIGGSSLSSTKADEVVVPSLVATQLTASGLNYPTADGTDGQVLTTDGAGNLAFEDAGGAAFPFTGSAGILGTLDVNVSGATDAYTLTSGSFSGSVIDNITDTYTGTNAVKHVISLTQAEYDAIVTKDNETLYYITDAAAPDPFPYSGSAVITGSLEMFGASSTSIGTLADLEGTIMIGNNIDPTITSNITGSINSIIGGQEALFTPASGDYTITDVKNSVIVGNTQRQAFKHSVRANQVTSSVVLASSNVNIGSGLGFGSGNTEHSVIIGSDASIYGGVPFGGAYSTEGSTLIGSGNPRAAMSVFGGRLHNLNAVYNTQVFGGQNNDFPNAFSGDISVIMGGQNNTISGGSSAQIVGGNSNTKSGGAGPGIFASSNTSFTQGASFAVVVGSRQSTMAGGDTVGIIGGQLNRIDYGFADFIFGGYSNLITGRNNDGRGNVLVGGINAEINGNGLGHNATLGGSSNTISGSNMDANVILGGEDHIISNHNRSAIIGGSGYTTTSDDQVIMPQVVVSGSVTNAGGLLTMEPWTTLPAAASHANTIAVQGGVPYFSDGASWQSMI